MLVKVLIGVAGVAALFVVVAATRPSAYHVERTLEMAAPADVVFNVFNDLRKFAGALVLFGSPLDKADPAMQKTFTGAAAGVGQSYAWSGKEAGKGSLAIDESVPGQKVVMTLHFVEPMESTATCALTVASAPSGSVVTWSMDGHHNFLGKAMSVFVNMDQMLGADLEKGLTELKTIAEGANAAPPAGQ